MISERLLIITCLTDHLRISSVIHHGMNSTMCWTNLPVHTNYEQPTVATDLFNCKFMMSISKLLKGDLLSCDLVTEEANRAHHVQDKLIFLHNPAGSSYENIGCTAAIN